MKISKKIATGLSTIALAGGMLMAGAAPAAAHYNFDHKPKSWICKTFNICSTSYHYTCGDPRIAYTRPVPCSGHYYRH